MKEKTQIHEEMVNVINNKNLQIHMYYVYLDLYIC